MLFFSLEKVLLVINTHIGILHDCAGYLLLAKLIKKQEKTKQ